MVTSELELNANGGWCWFQDPRVVVDRDTGAVVMATVANHRGMEGEHRDADLDITSFSPLTGELKRVTIANIPTHGKGDDHNVPALWQRPDGKYLTVYTGHNYGKGIHGDPPVDTHPDTFYRISAYPNDATEWEEEHVFRWPTEDLVGREWIGVTYSNLHHLSAEGDERGRLYNIARAAGQVWQFATSDDWGETWTWRGNLSLPPEGGRAYSNGYVKFASNGVDRIDFIITQAHPRDFNNGLYHGYLQGGSTYATEGSVVDPYSYHAAAPVPEAFTPVFAQQAVEPETHHTAWAVELTRTDKGELVGLFLTRYGEKVGPLHVTRPQMSGGTADHRLWFARLQEGTWYCEELGKMGAGLLDTEEDYTGLGVIDSEDGRVLYMSTPFDPRDGSALAHHELFVGKDRSGKGGGDWTWSPVTVASSADNLRPLLSRLKNGHRLLLWLQGTYHHQTDYNTCVKGLMTE